MSDMREPLPGATPQEAIKPLVVATPPEKAHPVNPLVEQYQSSEKHEITARTPTVREISDKYGVTFLHGIVEQFGGVITGSWQDRLDNILVNRAFSLCCLTVHAGDTYYNLYSPVGIVINQGEVKAASYKDEGSLNTIGIDSHPDLGQLDRDIDNAIRLRKPGLGKYWMEYNEFNVAKPSACGLYLSFEGTEDEWGIQGKDRPNSKDIYDYSQRMGLPVFLLEQGVLFRGVFEPQSNKFLKQGEAVSPSEINDLVYHLDAQRREEIIARFASSFPFPLYPHDADLKYCAGEFIVNGKEALKRCLSGEITLDVVIPDEDSLPKNIAVYLHAFADEAEIAGKSDWAERARTLASKIISREEFVDLAAVTHKEYIERYINPVLPVEDVKYFLEHGRLPPDKVYSRIDLGPPQKE